MAYPLAMQCSTCSVKRACIGCDLDGHGVAEGPGYTLNDVKGLIQHQLLTAVSISLLS